GTGTTNAGTQGHGGSSAAGGAPLSAWGRRPSSYPSAMQALEGLRVVDMATLLAGPHAARYLADFGADVVKVEAPAGDGARRLGWEDPADGETLMWKLVGRGKRSVVLDLKTPAGLDAMLRLLDTADVLVENLRPGTLERLGLDPERLLERNPGLVVLRVTGFGQEDRKSVV